MELWTCKCNKNHPLVFEFCPYCGESQSTGESANNTQQLKAKIGKVLSFAMSERNSFKPCAVILDGVISRLSAV